MAGCTSVAGGAANALLVVHLVREEIAASCEQAFPQLSLADLRKLLFLEKDADAMKFAEKVRSRHL